MAALLPAKTLSVSIDCPPRQVYNFAADLWNLPKWAAGLCTAVRKSGPDWIAETPQGPAKLTFADKNEFGVLDHSVTVSSEATVYVPMRVVANGAGSEVLLTLFRRPGTSDEKYAEDSGLVERDLRQLKSLLEG